MATDEDKAPKDPKYLFELLKRILAFLESLAPSGENAATPEEESTRNQVLAGLVQEYKSLSSASRSLILEELAKGPDPVVYSNRWLSVFPEDEKELYSKVGEEKATLIRRLKERIKTKPVSKSDVVIVDKATGAEIRLTDSLLIGRGGFGNVYFDPRAPEECVYKVLRTKHLNTESRGRFISEGKLLEQLHHRHIVRVYENGETMDGRPYIKMARLPGKNLAVDFSPSLFLEELIVIGRDIALALDCIHCESSYNGLDCEILHRDLKPKNIIYCRPLRLAVLLDFGCAAIEGQRETSTNNPRGGTLGYVPPTCLVGPQADIYQLGKTLHDLAQKIPAFKKDTPLARKIKEIVHKCGVRENLAEVTPQDCFETAKELAFALENDTPKRRDSDISASRTDAPTTPVEPANSDEITAPDEQVPADEQVPSEPIPADEPVAIDQPITRDVKNENASCPTSVTAAFPLLSYPSLDRFSKHWLILGSSALLLFLVPLIGAAIYFLRSGPSAEHEIVALATVGIIKSEFELNPLAQKQELERLHRFAVSIPNATREQQIDYAELLRKLASVNHTRLGNKEESLLKYQSVYTELVRFLPSEARQYLKKPTETDVGIALKPEQLKWLESLAVRDQALIRTLAKLYGYLGDWYRDFGEVRPLLLDEYAFEQADKAYTLSQKLRARLEFLLASPADEKSQSAVTTQVPRLNAVLESRVADMNLFLLRLAQNRAGEPWSEFEKLIGKFDALEAEIENELRSAKSFTEMDIKRRAIVEKTYFVAMSCSAMRRQDADYFERTSHLEKILSKILSDSNYFEPSARSSVEELYRIQLEFFLSEIQKVNPSDLKKVYGKYLATLPGKTSEPVKTNELVQASESQPISEWSEDIAKVNIPACTERQLIAWVQMFRAVYGTSSARKELQSALQARSKKTNSLNYEIGKLQ